MSPIFDSNNRRSFVKKLPVLLSVPMVGCQFMKDKSLHGRNSSITILDKEIAFVNTSANAVYRPVPSEFIFTQYPRTPEIPEMMEVFYSDQEERCTVGIEQLNGLGAVNEGVYREGKNIIQIIASTPGTPDTGSGSPQYKNWYRISNDGGKTYSEFRLIILEGHTWEEPMKAVKIGRNGYTMPFTCPIVKASNGEILVPINLHPWDEVNQKIYNPADAFLFGDSGVLVGKWTKDKKDIIWNFGDWLRIDHHLSTRGLFEPSITELSPKGRFAMVLRGSNYKKPDLPGYTWLSFSDDYCRTWSTPKPFTFSNGENFFTPASCSTLLRSHKTGDLYWIGNLLEKNSYANHPRNPLVIGRVDEENFGVIKESVVTIDSRHVDHEGENVELSNFKILQHGHLDEIVVALSRRIKGKWAGKASWYRIKLS